MPNFSILARLEVAKLVGLARLARLVRLKVSYVMLGWSGRSNECLCQISAS